MKSKWFVFLFIGLFLLSCAPQANPSVSTGEESAGFWLGLWHGFTILFTFIWSIFSDCVNIYQVQNSGGWYNFGYLLGVMTFFGGGGGGACKKSRKR